MVHCGDPKMAQIDFSRLIVCIETHLISHGSEIATRWKKTAVSQVYIFGFPHKFWGFSIDPLPTTALILNRNNFNTLLAILYCANNLAYGFFLKRMLFT